jgi:hypothetical protein
MVESGTNATFLSIWGNASGEVWVGGDDGHLLRRAPQ